MSATREVAEQIMNSYPLAHDHDKESLLIAIDKALQAERERAAKIVEAHLWGTMTDGGISEHIAQMIARRCQQIAAAIREGKSRE